MAEAGLMVRQRSHKGDSRGEDGNTSEGRPGGL